ncbi:hypothetical protein [Mesorhizobium sp. 128a]
MASEKARWVRTNSGKRLNEQWHIGAAYALYHRHGTWFNVLEKFPSALCDPNGYVLFSSRPEHENAPDLNVAQQTNVPGGIHRLSGYVRMAE